MPLAPTSKAGVFPKAAAVPSRASAPNMNPSLERSAPEVALLVKQLECRLAATEACVQDTMTRLSQAEAYVAELSRLLVEHGVTSHQALQNQVSAFLSSTNEDGEFEPIETAAAAAP